MGFKLPGKSMTSGTSAHSSALKMKAEADTASALKKTYKEAYEGMTEKDGKRTDKYGNTYSSQKEFETAADKWWTSEAGQKRAKTDKKFAHRIKKEETKAKPTEKQKVVSKGETKKSKITAKAAKRTGEVDENVTKKTAKITRKEARKKHGRGSKEHQKAKLAHLKAKQSDRAGGEGGKKQGLFRKLSTKINLKRQEKTRKKLEAIDAEKAAVKE